MTPVETTDYRTEEIVEHFYSYGFNAASFSVRTDTPDLMGEFREQESEAYAAMNEESLAIHADLAEASFQSLPAD